MADKISSEQRSWIMSRIRSQNTSIEMMVRRYLFSKGFRYRVNVSSLPGKPDIVLRKYNSVIFVHGCFWHRHENCSISNTPKTRTDYWINKFERNVKNDIKNQEKLTALGWNVIVIWECEIKERFETTMTKVIDELEKHNIEPEVFR